MTGAARISYVCVRVGHIPGIISCSEPQLAIWKALLAMNLLLQCGEVRKHG